MAPEHQEIKNFLAQYAPYNELPDEELSEVAQQTEVGYFKADEYILNANQQLHDWYIIRSGAVETYYRNGDLFNRLSAGGFFGEFGLLRKGRVIYPARAIEDTLIYHVPGPLFTRLYDEYESFAVAVEVEERQRLNYAVQRQEEHNNLMAAKVEKLLSRQPVGIQQSASIREAAELMNDKAVSSLLIFHHQQQHKPIGIITDKDLRRRVIATGLPTTTPVGEIMSENLVFLQHNHRIFEAMLMMLRTNIHHLPVLKKGRIIGMLALSDVASYESKSSLYVVSSILKQTTTDELAHVAEDVKDTFVRMVAEDANSRMVGAAMATIGRTFKQRLLELAEEKFGPPPVPYCFLALGSMARDEQSIVTDQDNAMILHDDYDPDQHDEYFLQVANFVCDGLAACGYTYCTGKIMATNPKWRQPIQVWRDYFTQWIEEPSAERLLQSSIFFDLAGVWGRTEYADELNALIRDKAMKNKRFLGSMARNALNRTPPLGFFKDFVMEKDGKHRASINTKRRGTAPVVDLIRVHALAIGSTARNSFARLEDIMDSDILPAGRGPDLRDALEFISMVRIRHQALAIEADERPDNNVVPEQLSDFERKNLKDAFQVLSNAQRFLRYRYTSG